MASEKRVYELKASYSAWAYTLAGGKQINLTADKTTYETSDPLEILDLDQVVADPETALKRGEPAAAKKSDAKGDA